VAVADDLAELFDQLGRKRWGGGFIDVHRFVSSSTLSFTHELIGKPLRTLR
jgi:hypothetical protein